MSFLDSEQFSIYKPYIIIVIILAVILLYTYIVLCFKSHYNFKDNLIGMWSSDPAFNKASGLDMAGAFFDDSTVFLFMVKDGEPIVNTMVKYNIDGYVTSDSEKTKLDITFTDLPEDAPFPKKLKLEYSRNKIRLYDKSDDTTYLILYKNQSMSEI